MQLLPQIWFGLVLRAIGLVALVSMPLTSLAEPLAVPGDLRVRNDLQLLNDSGVINVPLSAWPIALGDIHERKSKPKRLLIVLLGTLLGGIVGVVVQFGRAK